MNILKKFIQLLVVKDDPVLWCDAYKDKDSGGCVHVDGPLCDYPECAILRKYRIFKNNKEVDMYTRIHTDCE